MEQQSIIVKCNKCHYKGIRHNNNLKCKCGSKLEVIART
jgi:hypothetical protein